MSFLVEGVDLSFSNLAILIYAPLQGTQFLTWQRETNAASFKVTSPTKLLKYMVNNPHRALVFVIHRK